MIGDGYWSTGITVRYSAREGWGASLKFLDAGFVNDSADDMRVSTEGTLHTRYYIEDGKHTDALTVVIDVVKTDAERLGIRWENPHVYMDGDGEWNDRDYPDGWRRLVDSQAERLGWEPLYSESPEPAEER